MNKKSQWYFFAAICLIIGVITFLIYKPFLPSIALAAFFAFIFYPVYEKIQTKLPGKDRLSAALVVIGTMIAITIPLSLLVNEILEESQHVYTQLQDTELGTVEQIVSSLEERIRLVIPNATLDISQYATTIANWVSSRIGTFLSGTIEGIFLTFLVIFLFYYFLRKGKKIKDSIVSLSPLPDTYNNNIIDSIKKTVNSVLKGTLVIAIIQGLVTGVGLAIFGVPNPVIWGSLAAAAALVPGVGTGIVIIPSVVYLFVIGDVAQAIGLGIWGAVAVGLIDEVLVPIFYGKGIRVHPVFVLLAILGGINFFGILGFVFGPVILSVFIVLVDMYRFSIKEKATSAQTT